MKQKLIAFVLKRINWGKALPTLFRMIAEGKVDEALGLKAEKGLRSYPLKRLYWWASGKKTFTGATFVAAGYALEGLCAHYGYSWACSAAPWLYGVGGFLASVGLVDGGTRAPWPTGTPKESEAK